jgi:hypothetical protein
MAGNTHLYKVRPTEGGGGREAQEVIGRVRPHAPRQVLLPVPLCPHQTEDGGGADAQREHRGLEPQPHSPLVPPIVDEPELFDVNAL